MMRQGGGEPIKREDIRNLSKEVRDALQGGEESCRRVRGRCKRGKADGRRTQRGVTEYSLIGNVKQEVMMR